MCDSCTRTSFGKEKVILKWTAAITEPHRLPIALMLTAGLLLARSVQSQATSRSAKVPEVAKSVAAAHASVSNLYGRLPLSFEVNRGQADSRVKFLSRGVHQTLFFTPTESVFVFSNSD